MRLVRDIQVRNFRTLRAASAEELDEYVPIVGLNGSGKSNLLRALSLFFNGEVEPGVPVEIKRDHFDNGKRLGGKRRISVQVTFDLTSGYTARKEVQVLFNRLGVEDTLVVERAWLYADPTLTSLVEELRAGSSEEDLNQLVDEDARALAMFIRSIRLRYVSNHIRPSQLLGDEIQTLRRAINRRVRYRNAFKTGNVQEALNDVGQVARELLAEVSRHVTSSSPELSDISPEIPSDFAELAFQLGIQAVTESGVRQAPDLQGSGTQSYLLHQVLNLIDNSAFEVDFGWTKAVIWAIEEPESFLHAGLRTKLAEDLLKFAHDSRRQVFLTTHEPDFQRVADRVWLASRNGASTNLSKMTAREAVRTSSQLRISSYQHPLHLSPDRPLLIVEGSSDAEYITLAATAMGLKPLWTMVSLRDMEEGRTGGSDLEPYLRNNASVLRCRPPHAPVFVLRDWEDPDKTVNAFNKALEPHETSQCLRCPADLANPQLSEKFVGIERFLTTATIEDVIDEGLLHPKSKREPYPIFIERQNLDDSVKLRLLESTRAAGDPGPFMKALVTWIDDTIRIAIDQAPTGQMIMAY
jgi:energy-coupling factor transporter ATP-binding protein EcfA2